MLRTTAADLSELIDVVLADPGIRARVSAADRAGAAEGAALMNEVFADAITATGVNADGRLTPGDVAAISLYIRRDPDLYADFVEGHGDDEGNVETGYHLVQNDGGTWTFQGRKLVDTVVDAIYHIGFRIVDGRFQNEDGNQNERVDDVTGWLNWFLNGENVVWGTKASETLNSGTYSVALAAAESETFEAGGGNDSIWAGRGNDLVLAGSGNDRSGGGDGNDTMQGGTGADSLWGEAGRDEIQGGAGADVLGGGTGDDTLMGGAGNDWLNGEEQNDNLRGGGGNDTLAGGAGSDTLLAEVGNDFLWGQDGDDLMVGGKGNDSMGGGNGMDTMQGDLGNDTIWGEAGNDLLAGGAGNDLVGGGLGHDGLDGGSGNDTMYGEEGNDSISAGAGKDTVWGGDGNDQVDGGSGNDSLGGGNGNDLVAGGDGNDTVLGEDGNDMVVGGNGNDEIAGGNGRDVFEGGKGADLLLDWEDVSARDTFIFKPGDSAIRQHDVIQGFDSRTDKIDLSAFGRLLYAADGLDGTVASVTFDGDFVVIDANGDGRADERIELSWVNEVVAADFIL